MVSNGNLAAIKDQAKMSRKKKQQIRVKDDGEQEDEGRMSMTCYEQCGRVFYAVPSISPTLGIRPFIIVPCHTLGH